MKVKDMAPELYYKDSRDFSYLGRNLEVMLNHMKTSADLVNSNLNTVDSDDLINSLAYTLGFVPKHKYINKDLINVCSNFTHIMKNKGTIYAIEECVKILLNSQNITGDYYVQVDENVPYQLKIGLPSATKDIILLEDLFDYILPTGWIYSIVSVVDIESYEDIYYFNNTVTNNPISMTVQSVEIGQVSRPQTVGSLSENTTDVSQQILDNTTVHSKNWSGIVYNEEIPTPTVNTNTNEEENNGGA